jgi:hypothetical protein
MEQRVYPKAYPTKENSEVVQVYLDAVQEHSYATIAGARVLLRAAMKDGSGSPSSRELMKTLVNLLDALEREKE